MTDTPTETPSGTPTNAPKKKGISGWLIALVIGAVAMCLCVPAGVGAVLVLVPRIQQKQNTTMCAQNLRSIGVLYAADLATRGGAPADGGVRSLLRLIQAGGQGGTMLVCPNDPHAVPGRIVAVGDGPQDPSAAPVFRAMCSYMVRDFERYPLEPDSAELAMIAADANDYGPQHIDGINVLFEDGSVRFLHRADLDVGAAEPIVVGPESPHPELAKLCIVPAR